MSQIKNLKKPCLKDQRYQNITDYNILRLWRLSLRRMRPAKRGWSALPVTSRCGGDDDRFPPDGDDGNDDHDIGGGDLLIL